MDHGEAELHSDDDDDDDDEEGREHISIPSGRRNVGGGVVMQMNDPLSQQLDKMLEDAKIGPELLESLGKGMQNLADSANSLNGIKKKETK